MISSKKGSGDLLRAILTAICEPTQEKSMIDLMCHRAPITSSLGFNKSTYLDIIEREIDQMVNPKDVIIADVLKYKFTSRYDVAFCLDGIEHLSYEDGLKLIDVMKGVSDLNIIFTPLGELSTNPNDPHPDSHKFGWLPNHFADLNDGWETMTFPRWHETLNAGAFFAWRSPVSQLYKLTSYL